MRASYLPHCKPRRSFPCFTLDCPSVSTPGINTEICCGRFGYHAITLPFVPRRRFVIRSTFNHERLTVTHLSLPPSVPLWFSRLARHLAPVLRSGAKGLVNLSCIIQPTLSSFGYVFSFDDLHVDNISPFVSRSRVAVRYHVKITKQSKHWFRAGGTCCAGVDHKTCWLSWWLFLILPVLTIKFILMTAKG